MIERAVLSLINVSGETLEADIQYKGTTLLNLAKKAFYLLHLRPNFTVWNYRDCIIKVRFNNITFRFYCVSRKSFNVYMNPFFHEFDISTFVYTKLREGQVFVDVGAMTGLYTIISSKIVGNKGHVFCVEPNPDNIVYLSKNIGLNNLHNVTLIPKAVGEKEGIITLSYDTDRTELTSFFRRARHSFETEMTTLDGILSKVNRIAILKVDTEGYDLKVLAGSKETLRKTSWVIVEDNSEPVKHLLASEGFSCEKLLPSHYLLATRTSLLVR